MCSSEPIPFKTSETNIPTYVGTFVSVKHNYNFIKKFIGLICCVLQKHLNRIYQHVGIFVSAKHNYNFIKKFVGLFCCVLQHCCCWIYHTIQEHRIFRKLNIPRQLNSFNQIHDNFCVSILCLALVVNANPRGFQIDPALIAWGKDS